MDKQSITLAMALFLALTGCGSSNITPLAEPKFTAQTPALLRSIPISDLSLAITINNITKTFRASDFPDGLWQVDFDLQANQTYDLTLEWFTLTHLLLEETGQIFTDPDQQIITPELEFTSAGFDRFDDDCDGLSNLDEIRNGTSLTDAAQSAQSACSDAADDIVLEEVVFPWVLRQHGLFRSEEITSRVTSYQQSIQITSVSPSYATNYGFSLHNEPVADQENTIGRVNFIADSLRGKQLKFEITQATDFQLPAESNAECSAYDNDIGTSAIGCNIAFEWQERQWYTVSIEQVSATGWKAVVVDDTSGESQEIATIETYSDIDWSRSQNDLSHRIEIVSEQCRIGLAPVSMRYKLGLANGIQILDSLRTVSSDCVIAGGGWSEGIRTLDDELVYSLTLGRSE